VTPLTRTAVKRLVDRFSTPGSRLTGAEPRAATVAYWPEPGDPSEAHRNGSPGPANFSTRPEGSFTLV
jgi:hypothetical protein